MRSIAEQALKEGEERKAAQTTTSGACASFLSARTRAGDLAAVSLGVVLNLLWWERIVLRPETREVFIKKGVK